MTSPPTFRPGPQLGVYDVTLLDGSCFCRSTRSGDVDPARSHGLFVQDTRILSMWELLLDDQPLEPLSVTTDGPFQARFLTRAAARSSAMEPTVVVERHRVVANGMQEDVVVRNFGSETLGATLQLVVDADFADLFDVKDGVIRASHHVVQQNRPEELHFRIDHSRETRSVRIRGHRSISAHGVLTWRLVVPPHARWRTTIDVVPSSANGDAPATQPMFLALDTAAPSRRLRDWRAALPIVECEDHTMQAALDRSVDDLGSLRIYDPDRPDLDVVAAGAPWFMAVFGRDSLLTSWMTLPWDPTLARGTLHTLARLQGREVDVLSEEEPGRILHEIRRGDETRALGGKSIYYGSVDATPLFVMLLAEAARWGLPSTDLEALLPAADRALEWVERYGDVDGDGFVEYERKTDRGLANQGWKDSHDAVTFSDGRAAIGPIALSEVQAYVYAAYLARAELAKRDGDVATVARYEGRAADLARRFDEAFWLPDHGCYAMALDGDKRPIDAYASNQGHCLWAGIARPERADQVAERLVDPAMFTGWGVRTLAESMKAYNPISYHNGSVWPHDNALIVQGLCRYGRFDAARRIATGLFEASACFDGRLPELFCGFAREDLAVPVSYPTSCSPQAWAAATPIGLLTALLDLRPDVEARTVSATNHLPSSWGHVRLTGLDVGGHRVDVDTRELAGAVELEPPADYTSRQ